MIIFFNLLNLFFRTIQSLIGIQTVGVRAIVINTEKKILLVKHTYTSGWHLPGGGVKRKESTKKAIIRELKEEAGIIVAGDIKLFGIYHNLIHGANDYPAIYVVKKFSVCDSSSLEIANILWVHHDNLPIGTTEGTKRRINELFSNLPISDLW